MPEKKRGGGAIPIRMSSLQGEKVVMKIIYAEDDILMLMCLKKQNDSFTNNYILQRLVPP